MATALRVSFCFFCDAHLRLQVSRILLQYFQRYRFFSIFHFLVANNMTSSWYNLHNRKLSISLKRKKIFQNEKCHSSVFWKAFQTSTNYFLLHMHFKALPANSRSAYKCNIKCSVHLLCSQCDKHDFGYAQLSRMFEVKGLQMTLLLLYLFQVSIHGFSVHLKPWTRKSGSIELKG